MVSAENSQETPLVRADDKRFTLGDVFVVSVMVLVAIALTIGLVGQIGLTLPVSVAVAVALFFAMLVGHIALRRAAAEDHLDTSEQTAEASPLKKLEARADVTKAAPSKRSEKAAQVPTAQPKPASASDALKSSDIPQSPDVLKSPSQILAEKPEASLADAVEAELEDRDLGNFRPRSPADLTDAAGMPVAADKEPRRNIDDMIRRLAGDIEAGRKPQPDTAPPPAATAPDEPLAVTAQKLLAASLAQSQSAASNVEPPPIPLDGPTTNDAVPAAGMPPTMVQAASQPAPPEPQMTPPPSAAAKLAAVADALSDEQMDVFLETINGLEDYRAQHYEISVRLRLADGTALDNKAFISETRGTGLLPLLEAVKVSSTKRLAIQMIRRGRTGEFFSTVDGEALSDRQFSDDVDTITGGDQQLASRLVLAFTQADIRSLTPAQLTTLENISALGFRFSVEGITDLDMDFDELARRGFRFAKLDAEVYLNGLPTGTTIVPPADICRHLSKAGLLLIVGKIGDEAARSKILESGAILGQGPLFGAPRPVRADVLRPEEQRSPAV